MNISPRLLWMGATMLLAVAIVGCGGSAVTPSPSPTPAPTPVPVALVVEASEFKFVPSEMTIPSAGSSTIRLVNKGTVEHDFSIDALEFHVLATVGESAEGTLTDPAPGTYEVYCMIPGHKAAGMVGTLVVEG